MAPTTCTPTYSDLTDGSVSCTDTNKVDSVCTFTCNDGFKVHGKSNLTCTTDGWSGDEPKCDGNWSKLIKFVKSFFVNLVNHVGFLALKLLLYSIQKVRCLSPLTATDDGLWKG